MKFVEKIQTKLAKTKEERKMKNWSLKKKVLVGMGVLGAAAVGVVAYGRSKQEDEVTYEGDEFEDEDYEDYDDEEDAEEVESNTNYEETQE
jgi:hypothetical protein